MFNEELTVKEAIEILSKLPQDAVIMWEDVDGGTGVHSIKGFESATHTQFQMRYPRIASHKNRTFNTLGEVDDTKVNVTHSVKVVEVKLREY